MKQINIHTAKSQLSKLISDGKAVIITHYGRPVAKLVPLEPCLQDRTKGTARGKITIKDTFFAPLPDALVDDLYK